MPKLRKCCVVSCNANNETHRLFKFPKDDKLRELWLFYLVPVNVQLSGLTKGQLLNKYVCHLHFDRHQFDGAGNRLALGYPCLFTSKEILHGIPLSSINERNWNDHNYCKLPTVLQDSTETTTINEEDIKAKTD
ncbi:unnamed protein product [Arctia plantaginis]|uniref:THAP-type domain-containing protein n=1 Tax=Arctia plantaginis TaxID=874455 RepID=A0A8S1AD08_ARCPL|nr:unnamed protein product [Arctia plantaginis]